jgi:hypothetical protein
MQAHMTYEALNKALELAATASLMSVVLPNAVRPGIYIASHIP